MVKVVVKWGKAGTYDVDLDVSKPVLAFKETLYELTGVPVATQKLMTKSAWKGVLKDDVNLSACPIAEGTEVMLMGSSTGIPEKKAAVVFVEDMTPEQAAKIGAVLPAGLKNLGNTCYMNSTLQCLRAVPELRESLTKDSALVVPGSVGGGDVALAATLKDLFVGLEGSSAAMFPARFWSALKARYETFAEVGPGGIPKQQDSEEFQNALMTSLSEVLRDRVMEKHPGLMRGNVIDQLFGVEFTTTLTCGECEGEPPVVQKETARKVVCNIEGGAGSTVQINHLTAGIELGLAGSLEKQSAILGRNAVWARHSKISRLPKYLCIQLMRFYWKPTPESREHAGVKCKMMRPVAFPADGLDMFEFCTPELQAALRIARDKAEGPIAASASTSGGAGSGEAMVDDDDLTAAIAMSMGGTSTSTATSSTSVLDEAGLTSAFKGTYELYGVVTHKGRSADAGHYMGWVRIKGDQWVLFDDDTVHECKTEDILALKGGGDYDMASMLFYRAKQE